MKSDQARQHPGTALTPGRSRWTKLVTVRSTGALGWEWTMTYRMMGGPMFWVRHVAPFELDAGTRRKTARALRKLRKKFRSAIDSHVTKWATLRP